MAASNHTFDDNLSAAREHLARFSAEPMLHIIDGRPTASSSEATFENTSPIDGMRLGAVASGDAADVDAAARAAAAAFADWADTPGTERKRVLHRVADAIADNAHRIAVCECVDTGQTMRFMSAAALRGAENFRFFADRAPGASDGQALPSPDHFNYTTRRAIGPVGVITPWNTPFMLSTWKIAPALAAGCTVVHKPAEWSPITAQLLSEIALEAGLPAGVLNTVHGMGETAGKALTEHPAITAIAFNGERCTSSSRVLVQESIFDTFVDRLAEKMRNIPVGHPLDPSAVIGPLVHPRHCEKVQSYRTIAVEEGATVVEGDGWSDAPENGNFIAPMLFTNARNDMRIAQEEIFGPVLTAIPFSDEADAIAIANDVEYGLAGYLWTSDVTRAHRVADRLEAGMIWVNSQNVRHLPTPFGGTKRSGIGRDGGDWSFDFYMETKNIAIATGDHAIPALGG